MKSSKRSPLIRAAVMALMTPWLAAAQAPDRYSPPRLTRAAVPDLPAPTVVGGGEVVIEGIVDAGGALTRPIVVRSTPPYGQLVLDAIRGWRFTPALAVDADGRSSPVEATVTISAVYRPPVLVNAPTLGEPPRELARGSADAPRPSAIVAPNYPALARDGGVSLYEVLLDEHGAAVEIRGVNVAPGFDAVGREALRQWRFNPPLHRGRPAPGAAYVVFGFRPPVGLGPALAPGPAPPPGPAR